MQTSPVACLCLQAEDQLQTPNMQLAKLHNMSWMFAVVMTMSLVTNAVALMAPKDTGKMPAMQMYFPRCQYTFTQILVLSLGL